MKIKELSFCVFVTVLITGCSSEELVGIAEIGTPVVFNANTLYSNGASTRTVYSGKDENNRVISSSSEWERIDWVNDDLIRIWCDQEIGMGNLLPNASDHYADYRVISHTETSDNWKLSKAELANAGTNGLTWRSGRQHTFYAMYPSPATEGIDASKVKLDGNKLSGTIPATQTVSLKEGSSTFYLPDMNYGYMWAAKKTSPGELVSLDFKPLMTAFEFTVASEIGELMELYSFTLSSESTDLTGDFTATVNSSLNGFSLSRSNSGRTIMVDFGGELNPTIVTHSAPITFTVFALPQDISGLTVSFTTSEGTKKLALKQNGEFVTFTACKKIRITNLDVPMGGWEYHIDNLQPITLDYTGGTARMSQNLTFRSWRSKGGQTEAVPYTLQYSTDGGNHWTNGLPSWVEASSSSSFEGSVSGETLYLTMDAQVNSMTMDYYHANDSHGKKLYTATAKTNYDLSTINVATGGTVTRTTANCYVVQASGTYRFPLVYGNAIKGNSRNEVAYHAKDGANGSYINSDYSISYYNNANFTIYHIGYFKDHLGADIGNPFIASQHSNKTLTAQLLWMDAPDLVTNVQISGTGSNAYISFTVPKNNICQGNAVIAVLANGVVAWSWHIWVTDEDLTVAKSGLNGNRFAPQNLGWCDSRVMEKYDQRSFLVRAVQNAPDGVSSSAVAVTESPYNLVWMGNNPYYQWGRKDPMQAYIKFGSTDGLKPYYPTAADNAYYPSVNAPSKVSLGTAIQHPNIQYTFRYRGTVAQYPQDDYDWCNKSYYNLWNSTFPKFADFSPTMNDEAVTKSVYDPCPVGFKMPRHAAVSGFTNATLTWSDEIADETLAGRKYGSGSSQLFLPAVGNRGYHDGIRQFVGTYGFYWSAHCHGPRGACTLDFNNATVGTTGNYGRAFCFAVRPARE